MRRCPAARSSGPPPVSARTEAPPRRRDSLDPAVAMAAALVDTRPADNPAEDSHPWAAAHSLARRLALVELPTLRWIAQKRTASQLARRHCRRAATRAAHPR